MTGKPISYTKQCYPSHEKNSIVVERITTNSKLFAHTRMQAFRDQIVEQQRAAGVRVIKPPHALGFLDPNLPPHGGSRSMQEEPRPA